ncbi:hypothetical protein [Burkholderia sp. A2]|nr:hypothetical protein [Burkholderia sp. A2]
MRREIVLGIDRTITMFGFGVRERHIGDRKPGSLHLRERRQR